MSDILKALCGADWRCSFEGIQSHSIVPRKENSLKAPLSEILFTKEGMNLNV